MRDLLKRPGDPKALRAGAEHEERHGRRDAHERSPAALDWDRDRDSRRRRPGRSSTNIVTGWRTPKPGRDPAVADDDLAVREGDGVDERRAHDGRDRADPRRDVGRFPLVADDAR
jgi:hypothetical protein